MGYEDVNVTGKSSLSPQEVDARRKEFAKLREEGHTIELTARGKNSGVSYDYMDRLNKDIEAGIFEDRTEEGFTNKDKLGLANEFESVFLDHGYIKSKDDFLKMKASNKKGGRSYEITYDEYIKLANAAGYYLVEKPEKPATQKETKAPDNKQEQVVENNQEAPTQKTVEEQKNNKLDTVILDSITWTDENGKEFARKDEASINGEPYYSETGLDTFGTIDPETVDISKLSNKELKEFGSAPSGKKISTEPDVLPTPTTNDRALTPTEEINVSETPVTETPVAKATAKETPVTETPVAKATAKETPVTETPVAKATAKETPVAETPVAKATAKETPVAETPVAEAPTKETPVAETPKKSNIKQLDVPAGSLTKTQTEFSTASDKLKNIPMPQPSPKETNAQPTATATPKANTSNAKTEFENMVNSDPQLANKTDKERAEILKTKASNIEIEISNLQQPSVEYKKRLFGTKRIHATAEENREKNKEQIAKLEQELDTAKRNSTYANAIAGNITGFGATSLVDKNGNTVANYPQYTTVKYRDANGQESNVARVITYNITTKKNDINYYPFDVQKVNDLKGQPERWQAVPDMKNQLTDGQEIR